NFADAKIAENFAVVILALHRIGVHPMNTRVGKEFRERFLDFLRARAGEANSGVLATIIRANCRHFLAVAADVAGELLFKAMVGEGDAAIRAAANVTALRALQGSGIAAPVQKQNGLFTALESLRNSFFELRREDRNTLFLSRSLAHVHDADLRHLLIIHAL